MKYYLIAGEASGDLHGANLVNALKAQDSRAEFRFWGGDAMESATGRKAFKHIRDLAFMGFVEVLLNLWTILSNIKKCKKDLIAYKPNVLILIDYPGFNLRMAEFAKKNNIHVVYYISPQVWAWKANRTKKIKQYVDRLICILPFEVDFFKNYNYTVDYVGHPLLDVVEQYHKNSNSEHSDQSTIALIPGSRRQEISKILPVMLETAAKFPEEQFVLAGAPSIPETYYTGFALPANVTFKTGQTHKIMHEAKAALVASGTATLETALFNTPEVVCYKGSKISVAIARRLIKVKYISLVNLIMDKEIVTELIQDDFNAENCFRELNKLIIAKTRNKLLDDYRTLKEKLGNNGASSRTAQICIEQANLPQRSV